VDGLAQGAVLWLVVLGALGVVAAITLRRMSVLADRTRLLERFQTGVASIDARLATVVDPFVAHLDEIRRRSGDPESLAAGLPTTQDMLRAIAAEGRALKAPASLTSEVVALVVELDRAVRAADMVEHGIGALLARRAGRDLEAQTSLKRGALNLRHAREATNRIAREVAAVRPADLVPRREASGRPGPAPAGPTYLVDADMDADEPWKPPM
jgi:hypothetical protein